MSKLRFVLASLAAVGVMAVDSSVQATPAGHINYMTFSAPFALPGVSLPAGTYVFEVPLAHSSLDVVRVSSRDRRHVYATVFTQTVIRPANRSSENQIVFGEAPRGTPSPIRIWYPAGEQLGHEFTY